MMKFAVAGLLGLASALADKQACMNCKRADTNAGFMTSFSYCGDKEDQRCLQNFEEYINPEMQCISRMKDGWQLDLEEDCEAQQAALGVCPEFNSEAVDYGTSLPAKMVNLGENQMCTIMVDATDGVGRLKFSGRDIGVLYPGYQVDSEITVSTGEIKYITVYNGGKSGSTSFYVVFSGAQALAATVAAAVSTLVLAY